MARMFEYMVMDLSTYGDEQQLELRDPGSDGWELVAVVDTTNTPRATYQRAYFKREKAKGPSIGHVHEDDHEGG